MSALDDLAVQPFHDADAPQRARMLSRLADTELFVALTAEPVDDRMTLRMFPLDTGAVALACDGEDRLADFFGAAVAYVAMPGRAVAALLRDQGAGLLVNPGLPSEMLLDAGMLDWLTGVLAAAPQADQARLALTAPRDGTVDDLAQPLAERLGDMRGLISGAALAGVQGGGHVLILTGAEPDHQPTIAKALAEALAFLPDQPGGVDVSFADALPGNALQFDLTPPERPAPPPRVKGPPILR
ncbi:SseB family protein [Paracoccus sp. (in: a-proteobacteria)]|uniref:SseB family protein n=1 Tax=Paracoccus sp. TaxID=267 RepID=UPI0026DEE520|nr:SseB family protein [Paracoccus sp. (in: a-proteobacteria)]MDO5646947.1 SseB family protein [Paracoccus sp. (in: a-proteobacteria)]